MVLFSKEISRKQRNALSDFVTSSLLCSIRQQQLLHSLSSPYQTTAVTVCLSGYSTEQPFGSPADRRCSRAVLSLRLFHRVTGRGKARSVNPPHSSTLWQLPSSCPLQSRTRLLLTRLCYGSQARCIPANVGRSPCRGRQSSRGRTLVQVKR